MAVALLATFLCTPVTVYYSHIGLTALVVAGLCALLWFMTVMRIRRFNDLFRGARGGRAAYPLFVAIAIAFWMLPRNVVQSEVDGLFKNGSVETTALVTGREARNELYTLTLEFTTPDGAAHRCKVNVDQEIYADINRKVYTEGVNGLRVTIVYIQSHPEIFKIVVDEDGYLL